MSDFLRFREDQLGSNPNQEAIIQASKILNSGESERPVHFMGQDVRQKISRNGLPYFTIETGAHAWLTVLQAKQPGKTRVIFTVGELEKRGDRDTPFPLSAAGGTSIGRDGEPFVYMFNPHNKERLIGKLELANRMVGMGADINQILTVDEVEDARKSGAYSPTLHPNLRGLFDATQQHASAY